MTFTSVFTAYRFFRSIGYRRTRSYRFARSVVMTGAKIEWVKNEA